MVALRLDRVGAYHGKRLVVHDITTPEFHGGELVAVIGPNAAGKSTLFKRIAGLLKGPGRVELRDAKGGRNSICYMPQDTSSTAALTVFESVMLARQQGRSLRVADADLHFIHGTLAAVGITDIGFRTLDELSGGQRQLAGIAQTLSREPDVLLLDEPTSALDLHHQIDVLGLLQKVARERSIIVFVAIHDLNQALRFADRVMVVAKGELIDCGRPTDVITTRTLRDIYRVNARIELCSLGTPHILVDGTA
jgi:iron complex transport system ATP-binding protein